MKSYSAYYPKNANTKMRSNQFMSHIPPRHGIQAPDEYDIKNKRAPEPRDLEKVHLDSKYDDTSSDDGWWYCTSDLALFFLKQRKWFSANIVDNVEDEDEDPISRGTTLSAPPNTMRRLHEMAPADPFLVSVVCGFHCTPFVFCLIICRLPRFWRFYEAQWLRLFLVN